MAASRETNVLVSAARRLRIELDRVRGRARDAARRRRNAGCEYRPIFVAGAIGSGTSLLAASLAQRFAVAGVALESARQIDRRSCLWIDRVNTFPSIHAYEERLWPRPGWSPVEARRDLLALYRAKADAEPASPGVVRPFVDKGPNTNLVRAGFLAEAFPEGRFVLIFRDPVVNIEGFRRKWTTFREDRLQESVRFYAAIHEAFLEQTAAFPDRCRTVEYEALVADYEGSLARLAAAFDLEPAREERPVEARDVGQGRGLRGVQGGRIRVVRDANARSYATLSPDQIDFIRSSLSPLHATLRERAAASGGAQEIPDRGVGSGESGG